MLNDHVYDILVDFDMHLDDVSRDWLNPTLGQKISESFISAQVGHAN